MKISVLMPVYNGEKYIKEAIDSILQQTFSNFELLIVNDGSNDRSEEIIKNYNDNRIRLLKNERNLGLVKTLNIGLDATEGEYVARMDQDDISCPDRLEKQIVFMEKHPEVGVLGTWTKVLREKDIFIGRYYCNHEEIKASLIFSSPMAHPSVMLRKEVMEKNNLKYKEGSRTEDYELWSRMIRYTKFANLSKPLLIYRKHSDSMCSKEAPEQNINTRAIRLKILTDLSIIPADEEIDLHQAICKFKIKPDVNFISQSHNWLLKIKKANDVAKVYQEEALKKILADKWLVICSLCSSLGLISYKIFNDSELQKGAKYDWRDNLRIVKFILKCLIKR